MQKIIHKLRAAKDTSISLKEKKEKFEQAQKYYDFCVERVKEYREKFGQLRFKDPRMKEEEVYAGIRDAKLLLMQAKVEFSLMQVRADSMKDNLERFYASVQWLKEAVDQLETPP